MFKYIKFHRRKDKILTGVVSRLAIWWLQCAYRQSIETKWQGSITKDLVCHVYWCYEHHHFKVVHSVV